MDLLIQDVPTLVLVIVGVPAVLAAYIVGGEYLVRLPPTKRARRSGPGSGSDRHLSSWPPSWWRPRSAP